MFGLFKPIHAFINRRDVEKLLKVKRFRWDKNQGLIVKDVAVSQFNELLKSVTSGKHQSFDNFESIADDISAINSAIAKEKSKMKPMEVERNISTLVVAHERLEEVRYIANSITQIVDLAKKYDLTIKLSVDGFIIRE